MRFIIYQFHKTFNPKMTSILNNKTIITFKIVVVMFVHTQKEPKKREMEEVGEKTQKTKFSSSIQHNTHTLQ
jgi:hypothetical protein